MERVYLSVVAVGLKKWREGGSGRVGAGGGVGVFTVQLARRTGARVIGTGSATSADALRALGAEVRVFDPHGLPLPDDAPDTHPRVVELRALATWSEGMVWTSPERHGGMTGIMKAQIDWIPLADGALRPTQGKTLAVMQVSGGSQSFNAVNQLRMLGRWMRMLTISQPVIGRQGLFGV